MKKAVAPPANEQLSAIDNPCFTWACSCWSSACACWKEAFDDEAAADHEGALGERVPLARQVAAEVHERATLLVRHPAETAAGASRARSAQAETAAGSTT